MSDFFIELGGARIEMNTLNISYGFWSSHFQQFRLADKYGSHYIDLNVATKSGTIVTFKNFKEIYDEFKSNQKIHLKCLSCGDLNYIDRSRSFECPTCSNDSFDWDYKLDIMNRSTMSLMYSDDYMAGNSTLSLAQDGPTLGIGQNSTVNNSFKIDAQILDISSINEINYTTSSGSSSELISETDRMRESVNTLLDADNMSTLRMNTFEIKLDKLIETDIIDHDLTTRVDELEILTKRLLEMLNRQSEESLKYKRLLMMIMMEKSNDHI